MKLLTNEKTFIAQPCGNTIHRLITNIQRLLNKQLDVYIGENSLDDMNK